MKNFWRTIIFISLGVHLALSNAKVLYNLDTGIKNFTDIQNINVFLSIFFAISYAISTLYLINKSDRIWLIIVFAALDGILVALWYINIIEGVTFTIVGGSFYAVYTFLILIGIGVLNDKNSVRSELHLVMDSNKELIKVNESLAKKNEELIDIAKGMASGYVFYIKWRFNKSINDENIKMAEELFESVDKNFNFTEYTTENFNQIKSLLHG